MTQHDVIIIGGGVAGLSAGYFLSSDLKVLVLEAEAQPAYHSSGRSAALYIEGCENPTVARLTAKSGEFFKQPPDAFAKGLLLHDCGGLTVGGEDDITALEKYLATWQPLCPNLESIDRRQALELTPILRPDFVVGGAYDPTWMSIDVHELLQGYQRGIRERGGDVQTASRVTDITYTQEWQVTAGAGRFNAPLLVNAAGAWSRDIGRLAGVTDIELQPMRRTAVIVSSMAEAPRYPATHTVKGDLYFKLESPGLMACPVDETPSEPCDAQPDLFDVAVTVDRVQSVTNLPVDRVLHRWAGLRTFASDRRPVVGRDPRNENFFWLAGQGGFGVQTSPAMGEIVAAHLLHGLELDQDIDVHRLSP